MIKKLCTYILVAVCVSLIAGNGIVFARSSADIGKDIADQQKALDQAQQALNDAQNNLNFYNTELTQTAAGIPQIEAQINQINAQIDFNNKELDIYNQNKILKQLEQDQAQAQRSESIKSNYMDWMSKTEDLGKVFDTSYDFKKIQKYAALVLTNQGHNIDSLNGELTQISAEIDQYESAKADLEKSNDGLAKQKQDLEDQMAYYNSAIGSTNSSISSYQSNIANVQKNINVLSDEQRQAFLTEAQLAAQAGTGGVSVAGCVTSDDGNNDNNIQFCGIGNDFQQGNDVGLSQYGALGMGQKGYSAEQILKFYYTGVDVVQYNMNQQISVKYCSDYPALDAYQTTCNPGSQLITERVSFDQYLAGLGEVPSSWPLETRRAQLIAARTYAINYTHNGDPNYPICLTTYCQVSYFKNGDNSESDAVAATKDLIITYQGTPIDAMYGADNNQGFGSANYETIFQNFDGSPQNPPEQQYMRAVNDSAIAAQGPYTNWGYKSNTYSMDDIYNMMTWTVGQGGGFGSFVQGIINQLGSKPTKLSFERDPSHRVYKVDMQSQNGSTAVMGGWWFTYMYNVYNLRNGRSNDLLYSQTFFLHVK